MKAVILSVGDEVLSGDVINTNGAYLSKQLSGIGIEILYQQILGDNAGFLDAVFKQAYGQADVVITTGGLGPTKDDLTKETIARTLGLKLIMDESLKRNMTEYFEKLHRMPISENNYTQCMMPQGSEVLANQNGTAPGVYIEKEGKVIILFPGPPSELQPMFENSVKTRLLKKINKSFSEKYYMTSGIGESMLEAKIREQIPDGPDYTLNTYITQSGVMVKAFGWGSDEESAKLEIDKNDAVLKEILGESLYSEQKEEIWEWAARQLIDKNITLAAAESCTGGLFCSYLTKVAGISSVFKGGVVAYDNSIKMNILGVKEDTLQQFGAVSEQTAIEMAERICEKFNCDCGVGITGIAGPGGGTEEKPKGLVYVCVNFKGENKVVKNNFNGNREMLQRRSAICAFNILKEFIDID